MADERAEPVEGESVEESRNSGAPEIPHARRYPIGWILGGAVGVLGLALAIARGPAIGFLVALTLPSAAVLLWAILYGRRRETTCVPRQFGLGTILVGTTFFAVLFEGSWLLDLPEPVVVWLLMLLMLTGVAQWWAGPAQARVYSALVGIVLTLIGEIASVLVFNSGRGVNATYIVIMLLPTATMGGLFGYLAGAVMAGLFLCMDAFERRVVPRFTRGKAHPDA